MTDADVDGAHIKNLFYTFIWNFCPQLIQDGYIYAGVPPLYKVTIGKEYKYIKNDEELEAYKKTIGDKKIQVNRMKGLGEMSVDETEETLTDPDNRIIKQITVEDYTGMNIDTVKKKLETAGVSVVITAKKIDKSLEIVNDSKSSILILSKSTKKALFLLLISILSK